MVTDNYDQDISDEIDNLIVLIQKNVRRLLLRNKVKKELIKRRREESTGHLIFDYAFNQTWESLFKETDTVFSEERITVVYFTVLKFYSSFFNFQLPKEAIVIKESSYLVKTDIEFIKEFQAVLLHSIASNFEIYQAIVGCLQIEVTEQFDLSNVNEEELSTATTYSFSDTLSCRAYQKIAVNVDLSPIRKNKSIFNDRDLEEEQEFEGSDYKLMADKDVFFIERVKATIDRISKSTEKKEVYDKLRNWYYAGNVCKRTKRKHGIGMVYSVTEAQKFKYVGQFFNDEMHGIGILIDDAGKSYQGEFRKGNKTGFAIEKSQIHNYIGLFKDNSYEGYGEYTFLNKKEYYKGCFKNGIKQGVGYKKMEDGSSYLGHFDKGEINGIGCFRWPDGSSYFGTWVNGRMEGKGKFRFRNGDLFVGEYKNDFKNGIGKYYFGKHDSVLSGVWHDGKKDGDFELTDLGEKPQTFKLKYVDDVEVE